MSLYDDTKNWSKIIIHVDMNSFFASIEQRDFPELKGKPVAVTNGQKGSCIITSSYEARAFGIKTGMKFNDAIKNCPSLIRRCSRPKSYTRVSSKIMSTLEDISPDIEIFSIDEAFLDLTYCQKIYSSLMDVACLIKDKIFSSVNLPCSVGIAADKSTAKFAAKLNKPDGITIIKPENAEKLLSDYPVTELCGVSNGIQKFLNHHQVYTCGDMKKLPISIIANRFGNIGRRIWLMAQGKDIDKINQESSPPKSFGHGKVISLNTFQIHDIKSIFSHMSEKVAKRMRVNGFESKLFFIGIKLRDGWIGYNFKTTRFINNGKDIFALCLQLIDTIKFKSKAFQVQVTALDPRPINLQKDMFIRTNDHQNTLSFLMDTINSKYGDFTIAPARMRHNNITPDVISPSWRPIGHKKSV